MAPGCSDTPDTRARSAQWSVYCTPLDRLVLRVRRLSGGCHNMCSAWKWSDGKRLRMMPSGARVRGAPCAVRGGARAGASGTSQLSLCGVGGDAAAEGQLEEGHTRKDPVR